MSVLYCATSVKFLLLFMIKINNLVQDKQRKSRCDTRK
jgi:hypothetical protein